MKTKIALVGCGMWAQSVHVPFLRSRDDIELTVLTGVLTEAEGQELADEFGFTQYVHSWKEIADNSDIDAVIISTPHALHAEQIERFLRGGKHVHVDKPPTLKSSQLIKFKEYAYANNLLLSVHAQMKYMPGLDKVRSIMASNFSDIYQVNAYIWQKLFGDFKGSWRAEANIAGGGIMMDSGYHMIDTVHYLLKNKRSVMPHFLAHIGARNASDTVGLLTYALEDTIISISSIRGAPKSIQGQRIEIFGDEGYIEFKVTKDGDHDVSTVLYQDMAGKNQVFTYPHAVDYRADPLHMFIEALDKRNPYIVSEIESNLRVSISVIEILEKAYKKEGNNE
jgi:predicted dehydrogenase